MPKQGMNYNLRTLDIPKDSLSWASWPLALLVLGLAGCAGHSEQSGGQDADACATTRCTGERDQCVDWMLYRRDECVDDCSGALDGYGCISGCHDLADAVIASRCDAEFEECLNSQHANECWDETDPKGHCSGTNELTCDDVSAKLACEALPGCKTSSSYSEVTGDVYWSCDGQPTDCAELTTAESCRAVRCTWR